MSQRVAFGPVDLCLTPTDIQADPPGGLSCTLAAVHGQPVDVRSYFASHKIRDPCKSVWRFRARGKQRVYHTPTREDPGHTSLFYEDTDLQALSVATFRATQRGHKEMTEILVNPLP